MNKNSELGGFRWSDTAAVDALFRRPIHELNYVGGGRMQAGREGDKPKNHRGKSLRQFCFPAESGFESLKRTPIDHRSVCAWVSLLIGKVGPIVPK